MSKKEKGSVSDVTKGSDIILLTEKYKKNGTSRGKITNLHGRLCYVIYKVPRYAKWGRRKLCDFVGKKRKMGKQTDYFYYGKHTVAYSLHRALCN